MVINENWSALVRYVELQPGNATRYCLIITPLNGEKASQSAGVEVTDGFLVTWFNTHGMPSMIVSRDMWLHESYVESKMQVSSADALVLANFLNSILNPEK